MPPTPAAGWAARQPEFALRRELHFGDRVLWCFAERPESFHAMLREAMARDPLAEALVSDHEGRMTHGELARRAAQVAAGLSGLGVGPGDRVAALLGNRFAFVEVWLACLRLGAVLTPMNPRWRAREIAYCAQDSGARVLIHEAELADQIPPRGDIPGVEAVLPVSDAAPLFPDAPEQAPETPGGEEDVAALLYTSGTTGAPKGAMITQLNLVHSALHFIRAMGLGAADRTLLAVPASHGTGLVANIAALLGAGGAVIFMREFRARDFLDLASRERITHTILVPAMYNLIVREPELSAFDLSAWKHGGYGGAPMPEATIAALADAIPSLGLLNGYGSTETCSPATLMDPGETRDFSWSVGGPVHCAEIAVMDEDGRELPPGETGEVWIRGPMVVPGYWNRPEATAKEFAAGFWRSGDVGRMDAAGRLAILDRTKDMINRAGYKVFSVEVENVLAHHPDVLEVAVVGYPCPVLGERTRAHVVLREGAEPAAAEAALRAHAEAQLADYKRPDAWVFEKNPLPRNPNGKVIKANLRN